MSDLREKAQALVTRWRKRSVIAHHRRTAVTYLRCASELAALSSEGPPPAREPSDAQLLPVQVAALLHEYAERYRIPATAQHTSVSDYADRICSLFAPEVKP